MLEISIVEHDYKIALSEENLWASHLWLSVEVEKGIHVSPLDLIFPLLRLRHAIHVVFGGSNLQPLTTEELSLVVEIMSGRHRIPSAKEAKALIESATSSSQKKKGKRKRVPNTRVVDDSEAYKLSKVEIAPTPAAT